MRAEHYAECEACDRQIVAAVPVNGDTVQWVRCHECGQIHAAEPSSSLDNGWKSE